MHDRGQVQKMSDVRWMKDEGLDVRRKREDTYGSENHWLRVKD